MPEQGRLEVHAGFTTAYLLHVQFHVDKLSSAHIYLRMREGQQWDSLPQDLIVDLAQLTKANSIEGKAVTSTTTHPPPLPHGPRHQRCVRLNPPQATRKTTSPSSTRPGPISRRMAAWTLARWASRTPERYVCACACAPVAVYTRVPPNLRRNSPAQNSGRPDELKPPVYRSSGSSSRSGKTPSSIA